MEIVIVHINYNLWFRFPNIIISTNSCFTICYLRLEQLYTAVLRPYEMRNDMSESPSNIQFNVSWLSIWTKIVGFPHWSQKSFLWSYIHKMFKLYICINRELHPDNALAYTYCYTRVYMYMYIYRLFIVQAYQTSQHVVWHGGIFLVQYTRCSLCRLIRLLSTLCRAAPFFSASDAALSQEIPTVKLMSNQPALWTPGIVNSSFCSS
jgi:hypothetical protein